MPGMPRIETGNRPVPVLVYVYMYSYIYYSLQYSTSAIQVLLSDCTIGSILFAHIHS